MSKTVYIIPGFTDNTKQKKYKEVISLFKKRGFEVIEVKITWKNKKYSDRNMSNFVNEFLKNYKPKRGCYLFGFSFGAMISFIASPKIKPKKIILCSLSPYFKEDIEVAKYVWGKNLDKYFNETFYKDLEKYSFEKILKKINCKTILIVGDKEGVYRKKKTNMLKNSKEAHSKIKNSQLIIVKGADHNIAEPSYAKALRKVISKF